MTYSDDGECYEGAVGRGSKENQRKEDEGAQEHPLGKTCTPAKPWMSQEVKSCGYQGNQHYRQKSSKCKDPETALSPAYSRKSKETNEAGAESSRRWGQGTIGRLKSCWNLWANVRIQFLLSEMWSCWRILIEDFIFNRITLVALWRKAGRGHRWIRTLL